MKALKIRNVVVLISSLGMYMVSGAFALADTLAGQLVGHNCASHGKVCPTSRLDPHLALEADIVLVTKSGDYYFLTNVPRDTKIRHALKRVSAEGKSGPYNTFTVNKLSVTDNGQELVWSQKMYEDEINAWFLDQ